MPIYQTNTFICEKCDLIVSLSTQEYLGNDPIVIQPSGWCYNSDDILICKDCWEKTLNG